MNKINIYYACRSHPAGWSDDLGIMSPENVWLEAEYAGWHAAFYGWSQHAHDAAMDEFINYCKSQNIDYIHTGRKLLILQEESIPMLLLRYPHE